MSRAVRYRWVFLPIALAAALRAAQPEAEGVDSAVPPLPMRNPLPRPSTPEETAYYAALAEYRRIRAPYDKEARAYWEKITETRLARRRKRAAGGTIGLADYVLEQPPVYRGPAEPVPPPNLVKPRVTPPAPAKIPVLADFLQQAKTHFGFVPERAAAEADYKLAYAEAALALGIGADAAVRIYSFEAGGNGRHDVQAGLDTASPKRRAISTAIGYNQLLIPNTIGLLAQHGGHIIAALTQKIAAAPERRASLEGKIAVLRRMMRFAFTVPKAWSAHVTLARAPRGIALHALNLDIDIGPMLQAHKLADSIRFAARKGISGTLSAAELEMMNLMGDGSGFDVVSMPADMRSKVPTSNMFQRRGYERNPVARRNDTVASLIAATDAKMDQQAALPGAREMAAAFDEAAQRRRAPREAQR